MIRFAPLALCLLVLPAWADVYKWTDESGKIHYSDRPPPAGARKTETLKAPPPDQPGAALPAGAKSAKSTGELEMEFKKRRLQEAEKQAKTEKDAQAEDEKKRNCQRAQGQLAAMQRGGRITRYGPNGEQQFLTDDQIAQGVIDAQKTVDSWCK